MNKTIDEIFPCAPAHLDPHSLNVDAVPKHVAVIMDGNGRWAKKRGWKRLRGHKAGVEAVRETIRAASDLGVKYLTIYSFSSENWKRPKNEVVGLMDLFAKTLLAEVDELDEENVRITTIGALDALPQKTRDAFDKAWQQTKNNTGLTLVVAVNYGGRQEILDAVRECVRECASAALEKCADAQDSGAQNAGAQNTDAQNADAQDAEAQNAEKQKALNSFAATIDEETFSKYLYTAHIPDPDLLIRTSGEVRLSNFLLWQVAYSEFVVSQVLWPDFDRYEFLRCLLEYQSRNRRFGAIDE